jgi:hypothetical protein
VIRTNAKITYELDLRVALKDDFVVVLDIRELLLGDINLCCRDIIDLALLDHLVEIVDLLVECSDLDLTLL